MENNFTFLDLKKNDCFSEMNGKDLLELIIALRKYFLTLRTTIEIPRYITFGLELEFEKIKNIKKFKNKFWEAYPNSNWTLDSDGTLFKGAEIQSPIMVDIKEDWNELDSICKFVSVYAKEYLHSAGHIHLGAHILGEKLNNWTNFLKFWMTYENVIYRFCYNDYLSGMPGILYCSPISKVINKKIVGWETNNDEELNLRNFLYDMSDCRNRAVNFQNVVYDYTNLHDIAIAEKEGNTIEFRCPNGTLNPVIWQNNVNLFTHILLYSKSETFDEKVLEKRRNLNGKIPFKYYGEIFLDQAIEMMDLIFDNNIDKIYFFRQYIKNFDINKEPMKKTLSFTK